jgi:hypothetical protein
VRPPRIVRDESSSPGPEGRPLRDYKLGGGGVCSKQTKNKKKYSQLEPDTPVKAVHTPEEVSSDYLLEP